MPEDDVSPLDRAEGSQSVKQSEPDPDRELVEQFAERVGAELVQDRIDRGSVQMSVAEVDFEDPDLELPTCIFCRKPFSVLDGRKPYVLPCGNHRSCKQCLTVARSSAFDLKCPADGVKIDTKQLKTL